MKTLIAGANSYVGKHLIDDLKEEGPVVGISRSLTESNDKSVKRIAHDLSDPWHFEEKPDAVIYLATQHYLSGKETSVKNFLNNNIRALHNALEFSAKAGVKQFVFFSSISALGKVSASAVDEETPISDPDFYGATKYLGERMVREYSSTVPSIVLRLPGIIGPGLPQGRPWINKVVENMSAGRDVSYYNGDSNFNNICDVQTISDFLKIRIESNSEQVPFDIVNLAASAPMKMKDLIHFLRKKTKSRSNVIEQESSQQSFTIDITRLREQYDFHPTGTEDMLSRFIDDIGKAKRDRNGN